MRLVSIGTLDCAHQRCAGLAHSAPNALTSRLRDLVVADPSATFQRVYLHSKGSQDLQAVLEPFRAGQNRLEKWKRPSTSTPNAKTATAARVAGFLALFAAGTALWSCSPPRPTPPWVLPRTTPSTPSRCTARASRPTCADQHSGLRQGRGRHSRPITRSTPTSGRVPLPRGAPRAQRPAGPAGLAAVGPQDRPSRPRPGRSPRPL